MVYSKLHVRDKKRLAEVMQNSSKAFLLTGSSASPKRVLNFQIINERNKPKPNKRILSYFELLKNAYK